MTAPNSVGRLTKAQRRQARAVAEAAWRWRLSEALRDLEGLFSDWRKGHIDAFQLAEAIHDFHQGPNRELWKEYNTGLPPEELAARAIALDEVPPEEIPEGLREALRERIAFWKDFESRP